jgi:hypothetical protein
VEMWCGRRSIVRDVAVLFWCDVTSDVTIPLSSATEEVSYLQSVLFQVIVCVHAWAHGSDCIESACYA